LVHCPTKVRDSIIDEVNLKLQKLCEENGFIFMQNDNVTNDCLWSVDGLHLNNHGERIAILNKSFDERQEVEMTQNTSDK